MKTIIETPRLILREIVPDDLEGFFEMDSDPEVHRYLYNNPVKDRQQVMDAILSVRQQYKDNGIGRWAMVLKETGAFIGWTGMKLVTDTVNNHSCYYDIGYRLNRRFWGMGYATESALPCVDYAFEQLKVRELIGTTQVGNIASQTILKKCGLQFVEHFEQRGVGCCWLRLTRQEWEERRNH